MALVFTSAEEPADRPPGMEGHYEPRYEVSKTSLVTEAEFCLNHQHDLRPRIICQQAVSAIASGVVVEFHQHSAGIQPRSACNLVASANSTNQRKRSMDRVATGKP